MNFDAMVSPVNRPDGGRLDISYAKITDTTLASTRGHAINYPRRRGIGQIFRLSGYPWHHGAIYANGPANNGAKKKTVFCMQTLHSKFA